MNINASYTVTLTKEQIAEALVEYVRTSLFNVGSGIPEPTMEQVLGTGTRLEYGDADILLSDITTAQITYGS